MSGEHPYAPSSPAPAGLRVQVRFKTTDERSARALAARLIDRAHELANLPECECDLDVEVQWTPPAPDAAGEGRSTRDLSPPDR